MCLNFLYRRKVKRQLKNTDIEPKGVCIAIYCAKIVSNLLKENDTIYAYEKDLRILYHQLNPNNPYYDYDERQEIALQYLTIALSCKNGDFVRQRIEEEIDELV